MRKNTFFILAISFLVFSCTPAQRVEGTYTGDLKIIDLTGTMLATIQVEKVDDYHATFYFTSSGFNGSAYAVALDELPDRLEFIFNDVPSEGHIHYLDGNLADGILYSNFFVNIGGVERHGNLQNGRKQ